MKHLRTLFLSALALLAAALPAFADAAIPETMPSQPLIAKVLPAALGIVAGLLVGRYLAKKRRGR